MGEVLIAGRRTIHQFEHGGQIIRTSGRSALGRERDQEGTTVWLYRGMGLLPASCRKTSPAQPDTELKIAMRIQGSAPSRTASAARAFDGFVPGSSPSENAAW